MAGRPVATTPADEFETRRNELHGRIEAVRDTLEHLECALAHVEARNYGPGPGAGAPVLGDISPAPVAPSEGVPLPIAAG